MSKALRASFRAGLSGMSESSLLVVQRFITVLICPHGVARGATSSRSDSAEDPNTQTNERESARVYACIYPCLIFLLAIFAEKLFFHFLALLCILCVCVLPCRRILAFVTTKKSSELLLSLTEPWTRHMHKVLKQLPCSAA